MQPNGNNDALTLLAGIKDTVVRLRSSPFLFIREILDELEERVDELEEVLKSSLSANTEIAADADIEVIETEPPLREFTPQELELYDGKNGRPVYVSYEGRVYDVSNAPPWKDGIHFGLLSGEDHTIEYRACHAGRPRIDKMPLVGFLVIPNAPYETRLSEEINDEAVG